MRKYSIQKVILVFLDSEAFEGPLLADLIELLGYVMIMFSSFLPLSSQNAHNSYLPFHVQSLSKIQVPRVCEHSLTIYMDLKFGNITLRDSLVPRCNVDYPQKCLQV